MIESIIVGLMILTVIYFVYKSRKKPKKKRKDIDRFKNSY